MMLRRIGVRVAVFVFNVGSLLAGVPQHDGAVQLTPLAGPNRPSNVPEEYVITPAGYFHPSCVQNLARGERLLADGRVQHADGSAEPTAAVCSYPHYTSTGTAIGPATARTNSVTSQAATLVPEISGWIENAAIATGSTAKSYGGMVAQWTVPAAPRGDDGQVLFYFPGLEDIYNTQSILQPVLQWASGQWSISSWNCCLNGIITSSPGVNVSPGDRIYGSVTNTCPAGTLTCATWNVLTVDLTTGDSTTLADTPSDGQTFDWAFGGVLEPYYVVACDDYPPKGQFDFQDIAIFNENLQPIKSPQWVTTANTTATPRCGYKVQVTADSVTLDY